MNTEFQYLYRDGSNYKQGGSVIFRGEMSEDTKARLRAAFNEGEFFIADQIGVPEVFLWLTKYSVDQDDHCWHEYEGLAHTDRPATDERTIDQFVADVEAAASEGWKEFRIEQDRSRTLLGPWRVYYDGDQLHFENREEVVAWAEGGIDQELIESITGPGDIDYGLSWSVSLEET